jgi:hypothetical protein
MQLPKHPSQEVAKAGKSSPKTAIDAFKVNERL